jgi:hypothetical protein
MRKPSEKTTVYAVRVVLTIAMASLILVAALTTGST